MPPHFSHNFWAECAMVCEKKLTCQNYLLHNQSDFVLRYRNSDDFCLKIFCNKVICHSFTIYTSCIYYCALQIRLYRVTADLWTELQLQLLFWNQPAAVRSASTLTFHESVSWAWKQRPSSPWLLLAKSASSEHTRALYGKNTEQPKLSGPGLIWFAVRKQRSLRNFQFSFFKDCIREVVHIKLCNFS